ncbi:MAG: DUF4838 domain-containing protein [Ruminococcaceae bacterium]|nr:DUF4838 domain-containing protein [Oscillospiraceae bacterium]
MAKKLVSMLLALSMMLTMLAACNNDPVDPVGDPNDQQQEENQGNEGEELVSDVLNLVVDGVSDYVIVRGENAYISEVTASTELQKYLKQISGVEIPIVTDSTAPVEKEIVVGKTNREADGEFDRDELGEDGLVIKSNGQKLFLVGGEQRGTLYAVYEFLEAYLGCRFYTVDVEKIPEMKTIILDKIEEDKQIPVFEYREIDWTCYSNGYLCAKRKVNGDFAHGNVEQYNRIYEEVGGPFFTPADDGHNLQRIIPASMFAEHPEYFALNENGKRTTDQLCFTNPDVFQITVDYLRNLKAKYPYSTFIPISQNDTGGYCHCDECEKVNQEEGGVNSGPMLRFVNKVAAELKDEMPDTYVWTYAYQGTREAPINTVPEDNVIIWLCTIECCFSHTFEECSKIDHAENNDQKSTKSFVQDLKDWSAITNKLYIWNYSTNFSNWCNTNPNFDVLLEDMRFFADNGVSGINDQSMWGQVGGEFEELRCYLLSKIMWNPYMTKEEFYAHMDDFLEGYYGKGWKSIREFIDLAEELSEPYCWGIYPDADEVFPWPEIIKTNDSKSYPEDITADMFRNYETVDWSSYWHWFKDYEFVPQIITEGERLFADALAAAETDQQKFAVGKSALQVEVIRSYFENKRLNTGSQAIGNIFTNFNKANPGVLTDDEVKTLRIPVIRFASQQVRNAYAEKNKALVEKLRSYGVTSVREGRSIMNIDILDLTQAPADWQD